MLELRPCRLSFSVSTPRTRAEHWHVARAFARATPCVPPLSPRPPPHSGESLNPRLSPLDSLPIISYLFFYTFVFIIRLVLINFVVMVGLVFGALMDQNEETADSIEQRMLAVARIARRRASLTRTADPVQMATLQKALAKDVAAVQRIDLLGEEEQNQGDEGPKVPY